MDIIESKQKLSDLENEIAEQLLSEFSTFETPHGELTVIITDRFRRRCRKGKVWKSNAMLTALKNAVYGFNSDAARSRGGSDGIFLLDRSYRPENAMMKKIFNRFLDRPDPLISTISNRLNVEANNFLPVRLVSHHMRLLGVIVENNNQRYLILVDYDNEKDN